MIIPPIKASIDHLKIVLKNKPSVITKAMLWNIPHTTSDVEDIHLKIGRYKKEIGNFESLECGDPKSELTLDDEEFKALINFISENYEPFKDGVKKYIAIDESFDEKNIKHIKGIFENPNKIAVLDFISKNDIFPKDLLLNIEYQKRKKAIDEFDSMLKLDLMESDWQKWFKENQWVLGTEFVKILEERDIDTEHITDYLMQAYDGFVDIVEIKRPGGGLDFWSSTLDHGNYFPSTHLIKAITQSISYIYEIERESNSVKFLERVGNIKTIKPRCVLVFGRSETWEDKQKEACRILNASYHNITIMTYDHVLARAKRILSLENIN